MKIFSTHQMKELDRLTIQKKYSNSWELMENASIELFKAILEQNISPKVPILFLCGSGNNGGDGLAVARMMAQKYSVQVLKLIALIILAIKNCWLPLKLKFIFLNCMILCNYQPMQFI